MNRVYLKNHICKTHFSGYSDLGDLMVYLYTYKAIYFSPAKKVMPTKFFLCWAWMDKQALIHHLNNGSFHSAEKKDDYTRNRIKKMLQKCNLNSLPSVNKNINNQNLQP